eukprot:INCI9585.1.p1 GENE.INCI9585.1~~INCI9585.1.p1  ORF type:complete len:107 (-),score=6.55 INCI9585.1:281-601(-)
MPFEAADANSDGAVSWEEFRGPKGPINAQRFVAMDSNGDNHISRKEFNSYYRQHTGSPPLDADLQYAPALLTCLFHLRWSGASCPDCSICLRPFWRCLKVFQHPRL